MRPSDYEASKAAAPAVPAATTAGGNAPVPVSSWQGCADACAAYSTLPCKFWKYGGGGNWCQFFSTDVTDGAPVWPIPGAANASTSSVVSGTIPSFC